MHQETGTDEPSDLEVGGEEAEFQSTAIADLTTQIARACSALPPGPATEQLRNFCGRSWELLHTPAYAALERQWPSGAPERPDLARFYATSLFGTLHSMLASIVERGIMAGEFRPADPRVAARVILSAMMTQAFWCNHRDLLGLAVAGGCRRVVADTLSLVLGGMLPGGTDSTTQTAGRP